MPASSSMDFSSNDIPADSVAVSFWSTIACMAPSDRLTSSCVGKSLYMHSSSSSSFSSSASSSNSTLSLASLSSSPPNSSKSPKSLYSIILGDSTSDFKSASASALFVPATVSSVVSASASAQAPAPAAASASASAAISAAGASKAKASNFVVVVAVPAPTSCPLTAASTLGGSVSKSLHVPVATVLAATAAAASAASSNEP
mmetsp:Transcript_21831/g.45077  ORF Transcript_21831/g.45077 Transcript_21831/m.45077 type:complete len:202 (+) Transcript_21831:664-1269(+)